MTRVRKAPGRPLRNARSATGRFAAYAPSSGFPFLEEMRNRAFPIGRPGAFRMRDFLRLCCMKKGGACGVALGLLLACLTGCAYAVHTRTRVYASSSLVLIPRYVTRESTSPWLARKSP